METNIWVYCSEKFCVFCSDMQRDAKQWHSEVLFVILKIHQNVKTSSRVWANLLFLFKVRKMVELKIDHSTWMQLPAVSYVCSMLRYDSL